MVGRAGAAALRHGDLGEGCGCFSGPWLHPHLAFFAVVSGNWHGSAEAEPHPDWPGNGHDLWGGWRGSEGVIEGAVAFCCRLSFSGC